MKLFLFFFLSGFFLLISAKDYKGAEYRTKTSYLYGRFEVNYKAPHRDGILGSFFTYYDGGGGVSTWNEIDIEIMGRYYDDVQFNTITPGQQNHVRHESIKFNPCASYNTYAFEWTPDYVAWFINDVEVHRQTGSHIQTLNRAQKIMMNVWIPQYENWAGVFSPEALPAFAYYDWVKYYSYSPGSGNYGSGNNFTLQWTENFDYYNTERWAKATHTWNENLCDFVQENVVFKDGKMILCLTDAFNLGYKDIAPPVLLYARASLNKVTVHFSEELDSLSAINVSNLLLPGFTVQSASLRSDKKSVELNVEGLNLTQPTNLLGLNVKDLSGNKMVSKAVSAVPVREYQFPLRINVGGSSAYQDFLIDQQYSPATDYGYLDGTAGSYGTAPISGTEDDPVYLTDRYGLAKYSVRLPDGMYNVQLMFTENYFSAAGQRKFDIFIEADKKIEDLDLYASSGFRNAYSPTFSNIDVTDGILDIHFSAEINNPLINGIIITQNTSSIKEQGSIPEEFRLDQNYPNPFNSGTRITFNTGKEKEADFEIYNVLGQKVFTERVFNSGSEHEIKLDASFLSSGIYFFVLRGKNNLESKKMVLLK